MAASAWETSSSQCCSATDCACGDRGRWNNSSLLSKRLSEDSGRHQLLQKWANMWSTVSRDSSNGGDGERPRRQEAAAAPAGAAAAAATAEATALAAAAEEEEEAERLLVFLCGGCRRPLGDSLSWVTSQEDSNCILLRSVSANVSVNKEQILSKRKNENGCILEALYCTGCSLSLGFIYKYTPKALDYKRDLFCLSVEAIESYILGSSEKQIVSEDKELFNLESRVEIEKSLKEMEDVLKALEMKLWEVESKLSFSSCCKS